MAQADPLLWAAFNNIPVNTQLPPTSWLAYLDLDDEDQLFRVVADEGHPAHLFALLVLDKPVVPARPTGALPLAGNPRRPQYVWQLWLHGVPRSTAAAAGAAAAAEALGERQRRLAIPACALLPTLLFVTSGTGIAAWLRGEFAYREVAVCDSSISGSAGIEFACAFDRCERTRQVGR